MLSHNYYYFIASLPHINYGDKPPMSSGEFLQQCKTFLSPGDLKLIQFCRFDPKLAIESTKPTGSAFIDAIMQRERILCLTLASLRAVKLNRPAHGEIPQDVPRAAALAKTAFEMEDPLEAALTMDRARWGVLDEMIGINFFGVNNIFAYLLKLQLLERKQNYDVTKGFAAYQELYDAILNEYNSKV